MNDIFQRNMNVIPLTQCHKILDAMKSYLQIIMALYILITMFVFVSYAINEEREITEKITFKNES